MPTSSASSTTSCSASESSWPQSSSGTSRSNAALSLRTSGRQPVPRRERPDPADAPPEALDEPVADRDRGEERNLLRRDRGHERLERVGRKRRAEAGEADDERREAVLSRDPRGERDEVEVEAEELANERLGLRVERLHLDAAVRRRDPQLPPAGRAVQRPVLPDSRPVEAEGAEAGSRQLEGERLR